MAKVLQRNLYNTLTIDPGYITTGWAYWDGTRTPETGTLTVPVSDDLYHRINSMSFHFETLLRKFNRTTFIVFEGINLWASSPKSISSMLTGRAINVAYTIGAMMKCCGDEDIKFKTVTVTEWKGQLKAPALDAQIEVINGLVYKEHVREAVGIGFHLLGLL